MEPLRLGMSGEHVRTLQAALAAIGIVGGQPTGQFDQTTQQAVIEMQRRANLPQTGVVDEQTWNALYQMTSSVSPSTEQVNVSTDSAGQAAPAGNGLALLAAVGIGLATYWAHTTKMFNGDDGGEDDDERDDGEEEDIDDDDFEPTGGRHARLADLDDAVTDSLLDEPAVVASSRRPGDCKKAARMLLSRRGLAQRPNERALYSRVVKKVASDCHDQQDAVKEAIDAERERQDDIADELDSTWDEEEGPGARSADERPTKFPGEGFRKTKRKWTKKGGAARKKRRTEVSPGERDLLDSIAHSKKPNRPGASGGGRPGASAVRVKKRGGEQYRIRKEKAKTKRGHTWRKEKD